MIEATPPPTFLTPEHRTNPELRRTLAEAEHRVLSALATSPRFWLAGVTAQTLLQHLAELGDFSALSRTHLPYEAALESLTVRGALVLDQQTYRVMGGRPPVVRTAAELAASYPEEVHDVLDERYVAGVRAFDLLACCHPSNVLPLARATLVAALAPFLDEVAAFVGRPPERLTFHDAALFAAYSKGSPVALLNCRLVPVGAAFTLYLHALQGPDSLRAYLAEHAPIAVLRAALEGIAAGTWPAHNDAPFDPDQTPPMGSHVAG